MAKRMAILKRVPDGLLDGLPAEDQDAIRNAIGKPIVVVPEQDRIYENYPGGEHLIEVEFRDDAGDSHTIWVDADDLE